MDGGDGGDGGDGETAADISRTKVSEEFSWKSRQTIFIEEFDE